MTQEKTGRSKNGASGVSAQMAGTSAELSLTRPKRISRDRNSFRTASESKRGRRTERVNRTLNSTALAN
jgi:hypothetical protein